ncbi:hypothetical protein POM88_045776 [Heracleum sosnowskyi]|uniref:Squalene cyclase C-terminal domain-containing protein n=1 Tax=Heracleum sosnowskyi TaxID=360622 RepID=A0AAD8H829_9APIA|nr:hypothetical protein POM88_045776 [Heracleum sosnowskyi]
MVHGMGIGVCASAFTYGTWFAIGGLTAAGKTYNNCEMIRKAVGLLLKSQRDDAVWGESYLSCPNKKYTPLEGNRSNLVHIAWPAMVALIHSGQVSFFLYFIRLRALWLASVYHVEERDYTDVDEASDVASDVEVGDDEGNGGDGQDGNGSDDSPVSLSS